MSDGDDSTSAITGGWIYVVYLLTLAPWAAMEVFDAIDVKRRHASTIPLRLMVSLALIFASTAVGLAYVVEVHSHDIPEAATMLVGVVLNLWHWKRNIRGWMSYKILKSQRPRVSELIRRLMAMRLQGMQTNGPRPEGAIPPPVEVWNSHWNHLWVNSMVIDNDPREFSIMSVGPGSGKAIVEGDVLWRMFWLQGSLGQPLQDEFARIDGESKIADAFAAGDPPSHGERDLIKEQALDQLIREDIGDDRREKPVPYLRLRFGEMSRAQQERMERQAEQDTHQERAGWRPPTAEQRCRSLKENDVGQQDIGGLPPMLDYAQDTLQSLWCTMSWVTACAPRPMENIWYESKLLTDALLKQSIPSNRHEDSAAPWPPFPIVSEWYHIASDMAKMRDVPLLLSVKEAKRYALRLAAVSSLLAYHYDRYLILCKEVHALGVRARWTHGWSGRIACYSKYWTVGNVSVALLGGLPLLIITGDGLGNLSVLCLLVGLASENIMSTYLSDARRAARTKELERRYILNKGKTCRGSGVRCIRDALEAMGLPRSASQLDGSVAFASGWALEAVHGLPGNQAPRDGNDHGQIEDLFCSSRAFRFPEERT